MRNHPLRQTAAAPRCVQRRAPAMRPIPSLSPCHAKSAHNSHTTTVLELPIYSPCAKWMDIKCNFHANDSPAKQKDKRKTPPQMNALVD